MRYPNMSYCMVENTAAALGQVFAKIERVGVEQFVSGLNAHERKALPRLIRLIGELQEAFAELDDHELDQ